MAPISQSIFTVDVSPCGRYPIYVSEMSTWVGNGCPDPESEFSCDPLQMSWIRKPDQGETEYFVTQAPSGAFLRLYND